MTRADRYLTPTQAADVYDRIGRWQDTQGFYERPAVDAMVGAGRFERATAVVEVGCGTGGLAARLLSDHVPADATYLALDVSPTMVELTEDRLQQWPGRATASQIDGSVPWPTPGASADRVVAAYVLDLLSPPALTAFFDEAGRVLRPGGLVATVSLAPGRRGLPAVVSGVWTRLWRLHPRLTGGCLPVGLADRWSIGRTRQVVRLCRAFNEMGPAKPRDAAGSDIGRTPDPTSRCRDPHDRNGRGVRLSAQSTLERHVTV